MEAGLWSEDIYFWNVGFELTVRETQFAIHFDNFTEHFFLIFGKFANQSLIVKLSFNFKHKWYWAKEKRSHVGFGNE